MAIADLHEQLERLNRIGIALSSERNLNRLLEMIVDYGREFTNADGGTLYRVREQENNLKYEITQNASLGLRGGGTSGKEISLLPVPLSIDGRPNLSHVAAYVAHTGELLNIPDVYEAKGFDFSGPRRFDAHYGYRTKSMLTIPMRNHEDETIGVLQLINALDSATGEFIPFDPDCVDLATSLASQAAVAITNTSLIQELQELFEAFIRSVAVAIERKSPYTGGHIRRVTELTVLLAEKVNEIQEGPLADVHFTPDELNELRIAAWMHDIGKITTPEYVVDKRTKLETICDRVEIVRARFQMIRTSVEAEAMRQKVDLLSRGTIDLARLREIDETLEARVQSLQDDLNFIVECNKGAEFMSQERLERLRRIAQQTYYVDGKECPYLTEDEVYNLSISRGTLNAEEWKIMKDHAMMSIKILRELPFPKKLRHVPEYAGGHHERLDGTGYPLGLKAEQLPIQARIMAIADVFEALTAKDRPYKKPWMLSQAINILRKEAQDRHVDGDIVDLFLKTRLFEEYARKELNPAQIDTVP